MKKIIIFYLITILLFNYTMSVDAEDTKKGIVLLIDNKVTFLSNKIIYTNKVYLPLYEISEDFKCKITKNKDYTYIETIDSNRAIIANNYEGIFINDYNYSISYKPIRKGNEIYVTTETLSDLLYVDIYYDDIENKVFIYNPLFPICVEDKYGFIDKKGNIVIEPQFDDVGYVFFRNTGGKQGPYGFHNGYSAVKVDQKWGVVDINGNYIVKPKYSGVESFEEGRAYVYYNEVIRDSNGLVIEETYKTNYIDTKGKEISPVYFDVNYSPRAFYEGLAIVNKDNKYGYINKTGQIQIPLKYGHLQAFSEGLAFVTRYGKGKEAGFYLIDISGKAIKSHFEFMGSQYSEGLSTAAMKKNGNILYYGFVDKKGNKVIDFTYLYANAFTEGLSCVQNVDYRYGFIDKSNKTIIPMVFNQAYPFYRGFARVYNDDGWGVINHKGKFITKEKYAHLNSFYNGVAVANKNATSYSGGGLPWDGQWGLINTKGEEILPFKYEYITDFHNGMARVYYFNGERISFFSGRNFGYINTKSEWIYIPKVWYTDN